MFKLIQEELIRVNGTGVDINFQNDRNQALLSFKDFKDEEFYRVKCDDDYYNTYLWLNITPSHKIRKELKKRDF